MPKRRAARTAGASSPFKSAATAGRDNDHAGPSAKQIVLKAAKAVAAPTMRHDGSTITSMPSGRTLPSHADRAPVAHQPNTTPAAAPIDASSRPSVRSCRTIGDQLLPTARESAIANAAARERGRW